MPSCRSAVFAAVLFGRIEYPFLLGFLLVTEVTEVTEAISGINSLKYPFVRVIYVFTSVTSVTSVVATFGTSNTLPLFSAGLTGSTLIKASFR